MGKNGWFYRGMQTLGKKTFVDPMYVKEVNGKDDADELFVYLIGENIDGEWNFGRFIIHMECMREQPTGTDFEDHKN